MYPIVPKNSSKQDGACNFLPVAYISFLSITCNSVRLHKHDYTYVYFHKYIFRYMCSACTFNSSQMFAVMACMSDGVNTISLLLINIYMHMPTMHPLTRLYIFSRNLRATPQKADTIEASRSEKINVSLPKTPQNPSENGHATSGEIVDTTFGDDEISIAPTATDATSPPASATAGDAAANAEEHSISAASACLPTILEVPSAPSTPAHPTEARTPSASTPAAAEKDGILESVDPLELGKGGDGTVGTITLQHAADAKTGAADDASVAADGESVELRSEDATAGTEEAKTEVLMISSGDTLQLQHTVRHPATHCNALQCTATHCR